MSSVTAKSLDAEEVISLLEKVAETGSLRLSFASGPSPDSSLYQDKSRSSEEIRDNLTNHSSSFSINYGKGTVRATGFHPLGGPVPALSYVGDLDMDSGEEYEEFLEESDYTWT